MLLFKVNVHGEWVGYSIVICGYFTSAILTSKSLEDLISTLLICYIFSTIRSILVSQPAFGVRLTDRCMRKVQRQLRGPLLSFLYPYRYAASGSKRFLSSVDKDDNPWAYLYSEVGDETGPDPVENDKLLDKLYGFIPKKSPSAMDPSPSRPLSKSTFHSARDARVRDGTMTLREREMFSRIFETILSDKSSPKKPAKGRDELFSFGPEETSTSPTKKSVLGDLSAYPAPLREAAARVQGLQVLRNVKSARQEKLQKVRESHEFLALSAEMQACDSDVALQTFMDSRIFAPIASGILVSKKRKDGGTSSGSGTVIGRTERESIAVLYPLLLADAMSCFRVRFRDYVSTISVLDTIKRLGLESYVVGAGIGVYNQLLLCKWEGWHDLAAVEEILEEMEVNGIAGDDQTAEVLKGVRTEIERARTGSSGGKAIWGEEELSRLDRITHSRLLILERERIAIESQAATQAE